MIRPLLAFALLSSASCAGEAETRGSGSPRAPERPASSAVEMPASTSATSVESPPAVEEDQPAGPYRLTLTPSATTASTAEEVVVSWKLEGGPRAKTGVVPHVRIAVVWIDLTPAKAGTRATGTPPKPPSSDGDECTAPQPTDEKIAFAMQARQSAIVRGSIVGCRDGTPVEETRARAESRVDWVAPYIIAVDIPGVLGAGTAAQGTIRFNGIDGPKAIGAPKAVKMTSSNPGVTITRQPTVAASSTFEVAVRPDATGEAQLTAEHVNTNGSGRILGVLRKTAIVQIRARPAK